MLRELTVQHELFRDGCSLRARRCCVRGRRRSGTGRALTSAPKVARACKMKRGNRNRSVTSVARICCGKQGAHVSCEGREQHGSRDDEKRALYQVGGTRFVGGVAQNEVLLHQKHER